MARSSRFRTVAIAAAVAFSLVAATVSAAAVQAPTGKLVAGAEERVLRLHDLPPGYTIGDDSYCEPIGHKGTQAGLAKFIAKYRPGACNFEYERLFEVPGPQQAAPLVEAATIATPDPAAARKLFKLLIDTIDQGAVEQVVKVIAPPPALGEEARFYRSRELVEGKPDQPGSALYWRQGSVIGALQVAGLTIAANDPIALQLAATQQKRMLAPTPYTEAERDDTTVSLDDPKLSFPLYWLGSRFAPDHGLPASDLYEAFTMLERGTGPPGAKVALWYEGFQAYIWTAKTWGSFQRSLLGPYNRQWKCTKSFPVALERGRAQVFAAYTKDFRRCPRRAPDRFYAIAHIDGTVVAVNPIICTACREPTRGAYGSLRGMKAIVRGLELRPKPVYSAAP